MILSWQKLSSRTLDNDFILNPLLSDYLISLLPCEVFIVVSTMCVCQQPWDFDSQLLLMAHTAIKPLEVHSGSFNLKLAILDIFMPNNFSCGYMYNS